MAEIGIFLRLCSSLSSVSSGYGHRSLLPVSIPKLIDLPGTIWCLCDQVQSASRFVSQETSWEARCCRGNYSSYHHRNDRVLQSVFANRHDREHVHPLSRVRGWRGLRESLPVSSERPTHPSTFSDTHLQNVRTMAY